MGDAIVLTAVAAAVFFAIRSIVKDRRSGGCSGCGKCSRSGSCSGCKSAK